MIHAVSLLALSATAAKTADYSTVAKLWIVGTALFSGSLYGLALNGPRLLGPVTPVGGLCFIAGWGILIAKAPKSE